MGLELKILVVDDEIEFRELLKIILQKKGYIVDMADNGEMAINMINSEEYDIVLTDMMMDGMNGIQVLEYVKSLDNGTECIIITGFGSIENAVDAIKNGAFSYFIKSNSPQELIFDIEKIKKIKMLSKENNLLKKEFGKSEFILTSKSPLVQKTIKFAEKAAGTDSNILILGESGVGKEVIARYIHMCSNRRNEIFMPVNCYSFSDSLLEAELYGHEKGSFTGSNSMRIGRFEASNNGTLFLDEIGDIPLSTQVKILRNIERKEIERIGSNKTIKTDFRLISATNKNLNRAIVDKNFREDLYYRISTVIIEIPPLRQRKEDLPILIDYFLQKIQMETKKRIEKIDENLLGVLMNYDYPGNIRELKNIIERLVVFAEGSILTLNDIKHYDIFSKADTMDNCITLKQVRQSAEKNYIIKILENNDYKIDKCSKILDISSRQLYNKINEYDINIKYV